MSETVKVTEGVGDASLSNNGFNITNFVKTHKTAVAISAGCFLLAVYYFVIHKPSRESPPVVDYTNVAKPKLNANVAPINVTKEAVLSPEAGGKGGATPALEATTSSTGVKRRRPKS